jgi:hypothetical protein
MFNSCIRMFIHYSDSNKDLYIPVSFGKKCIYVVKSSKTLRITEFLLIHSLRVKYFQSPFGHYPKALHILKRYPIELNYDHNFTPTNYQGYMAVSVHYVLSLSCNILQ